MAHNMTRRRLLQTATASTVLLAGCIGNLGDEDDGTDMATTTTASTQEETESPMTTPKLSVTDQTTDGSTVTVPEAAIDESGWLVVHPEADDGGPNGTVVLATEQLAPGMYADQTLSVEPTLSEGQTLYAMLHYDDPADDSFTFPQDGDPPVKNDGSPIVKPFDVTISAGTTTVEAISTSFKPERVAVEPGTTVEWVNEDSIGHDVTSASFHDKAKSWDMSATLSGNGGTASHTFQQAGVYEYYCTIHGKNTMCGAVLVGDATLDADLPCEGSMGGGY